MAENSLTDFLIIANLTVADKGKPWFMYEAFQFIIKAQVEYLISLGVDPVLKVSHSSVVTTFCSMGCALKSNNRFIIRVIKF